MSKHDNHYSMYCNKFFNYRALIGGKRKSILGFATAANLKPNNDIMEEMQIKMLYSKQVPKETN